MNRTLRRHIIDNRMRDRNRGNGGYNGNRVDGGQYGGEFYGNYNANIVPNGYDGNYMGTMPMAGYPADYAGNYPYNMPDGRQGVKYTGPYGIGGSKHYPKGDRDMYDGNDYAGDEEPLKLTKSEMREWKEDLMNADGTHGAHFTQEQIMQAMQALGLQPRGYTEKELCLTANMLYSDYCKVFEQFIPRDKEAMVYVKMAKAFLDDPDASVKGGEKLAAYYFAVVEDDE